MTDLMGHSLFMWPILLCGLLSFGLILERSLYLFLRAGVSADEFGAKLQREILAGNMDGAMRLCSAEPWAPVARVARAALLHAHADRADLELAVEQATLDAAPMVQKRVAYLATIANVATLFGLLGTIVGLIGSFDAVSHADLSEKQTLLAKGISTAMFATAGGITVAIPSLIAYSLLVQRSNALLDDMDRIAARMVLLLHRNAARPATGSADAPGAVG